MRHAESVVTAKHYPLVWHGLEHAGFYCWTLLATPLADSIASFDPWVAALGSFVLSFLCFQN